MRKKIDRRKFLEKIGRGLVGIVGAGTVGCDKLDRKHNEYVGFDSHPVDQIFRDHDGYRLIYSDEEDVLREIKYYATLLNSGNKYPSFIENVPEETGEKFRYNPPVNFDDYVNKDYLIIIKDLKEGKRGFANTLKYNVVRKLDIDLKCHYTEVHLPRNSSISPGNEVFGGKFRVEAEMNEVK